MYINMKSEFIETQKPVGFTFPAFMKYTMENDPFNGGVVVFHEECMFTVLHVSPNTETARYVGELIINGSPIGRKCWSPASGTIRIELP